MADGIRTENLTKRYGRSSELALDNLSLHVKQGEVYGYLGANGAGKSTTIRLLLNFLQPTSGSASISGHDCQHEAVQAHQHVGYLAGEVALYPKATGRDTLAYLAKLQGAVDRDYQASLIKRFEADLDKPVQALSKGNRQKIGIIQALQHRPSVLILDEPTSGLDPLMQEAFSESIREARSYGAAILMSSHNLTEAQSLCDRIGIIKHGKLIHEQAADAFVPDQRPTFRVQFAHGVDAAKLKAQKALHIVSQVDDHTWLIQPAEELAAALRALSTLKVQSLESAQNSLTDEFLEFYGDGS